MKSQTWLSVSALLTAVTATAASGAPFTTDDPEPVEYGHFENNLFTSGTMADDAKSGTLLGLEINYGVLPDLQVSVAIPLEYESEAGSPITVGLHGLEFGTKYRFVQEDVEGWIPQVSFGPSLDVALNAAPGEGAIKATLPVWAQKSFGDWTVFGGGGYAINPGVDDHDYWLYGIAAVRQIVPDFSLGAEVYGQTRDTVTGTGSTSVAAGGTWDISDAWHLSASLGTGLVNRTANNELSYYLGIAWTI